MVTWNRDVRRSSLGLDTRSVAERSAALESLKSFSEMTIGGDPGVSADVEDADVEAVSNEVAKARAPLAIGDLAKILNWDVDRLSAALARGGDSGRLVFSTAGARTFVALPPPSV